ncbi:MAG: hypothetical protein ACI3YH_02200 [Eubacteriales bacterium]
MNDEFFVSGDTHGSHDLRKLTSERFSDRGMTKDDYVLICGDFSAVRDESPSDAYLQQ